MINLYFGLQSNPPFVSAHAMLYASISGDHSLVQRLCHLKLGFSGLLNTDPNPILHPYLSLTLFLPTPAHTLNQK